VPGVALGAVAVVGVQRFTSDPPCDLHFKLIGKVERIAICAETLECATQ
jgi:hypothetical protein